MTTSPASRVKAPRVPRRALRHPLRALALGFGLGLLPRAPGTWGALLGIPLALALSELPLAAGLLGTVVVFGVGVWACEVTSRWLGVEDHSAIVWDEVLGYVVTVIWFPPSWLAVVAGFVLFRVFDILKPGPIRWAERRVSGGLGVMLDDLLAGLAAALVLWGVLALAALT